MLAMRHRIELGVDKHCNMTAAACWDNERGQAGYLDCRAKLPFFSLFDDARLAGDEVVIESHLIINSMHSGCCDLLEIFVRSSRAFI